MERRFYDIGIIGGGVIGSAIAYYTLQKSDKKVFIMDTHGISSGYTAQSAGIVSMLKDNNYESDLACETKNLLKQLERDTKEDLGIREIGSFHLVKSENIEKYYAEKTEYLYNLGLIASRLDNVQAKRMIDWLDYSNVKSVYYVNEDFKVDPYVLTRALIKRASKQKISILENSFVKEVTHDGNVFHVNSTSGRYTCEKLLVCAGVWSNNILKDFEVTLPYYPIKTHYWVSAKQEQFYDDFPIIKIPSLSAYFRNENGCLLTGLNSGVQYPYNPDDLKNSSDATLLPSIGKTMEDLEAVRSDIAEFIPGFTNLDFTYYVNGLEGYTPDSKMIVSGINEVPGLFVATAFNSIGLSISGGIGNLASDLLLENKVSEDISKYSYDRLGKIDLKDQNFIQSCIDSKTGLIGNI